MVMPLWCLIYTDTYININACIFTYSHVGCRSDKTVVTFLLLYVYVNVCIYIYDFRHVGEITKLFECMALRQIHVPVARHEADPGPVKLFPSIVGQSRQRHHMIISLTKNGANTRH